MGRDLISIIVPVYNVEKYIEKCVYSLANQDYSNIEIILVDDGSPDSSGFLIDEISKTDDRVTVIHKENAGVSTARNAGLQVSKGKYIMFVDGDDWVDEDYVSYFYDLLSSNDCEIAFNKSNYYITAQQKKHDYNKKNKVTAEKAIEWIYSDEIFVAVWNKIYKSSILKDNDIKFSEDIWYGEGMLFNIECLQCVENVAIGEKMVYHQTFNPDSAMRSFNLRSNYCGLSSMWLQRAHWIKYNKSIENEWRYHVYRFNRSIIDGLTRSNLLEENRSVYRECTHDLRKNIFIPMKYEKKFKKKISWLCYFISPFIMAKRSAKKFKHSLQMMEKYRCSNPWI